MLAFTGSSCAAEFKVLRRKMKMRGKKERYNVKQWGLSSACGAATMRVLPSTARVYRSWLWPARRCLSARRCAATRGSARRGRGTHRAISRDGPLRPVAPRCAPLRPAARRYTPLRPLVYRRNVAPDAPRDDTTRRATPRYARTCPPFFLVPHGAPPRPVKPRCARCAPLHPTPLVRLDIPPPSRQPRLGDAPRYPATL